MSIKRIMFSFLAAAAFSTAVMAQGGQQPNQPNQPRPNGMRMMRGGGEMGRRGPRMGGMVDFSRLNLTDAQKQRIQAILDSNSKSRDTMQSQFQEMGKLMMLKRQGLLTTEQGTRLTAMEAQMTSNRDRFRNDVLAVLTPEQKTLFDQMQNERGGMRGMRDGGGREGGRMKRGRMSDGMKRPGAPNAPQTPPNM